MYFGVYFPAVSSVVHKRRWNQGSISWFENRNRGNSEAWRGMGVGRVGKTVCSRSQISCCLPAPACYFKWLCGSCPESGKSHLTFNPLQLIKTKMRVLILCMWYPRSPPVLWLMSLCHSSRPCSLREVPCLLEFRPLGSCPLVMAQVLCLVVHPRSYR